MKNINIKLFICIAIVKCFKMRAELYYKFTWWWLHGNWQQLKHTGAQTHDFSV